MNLLPLHPAGWRGQIGGQPVLGAPGQPQCLGRAVRPLQGAGAVGGHGDLGAAFADAGKFGAGHAGVADHILGVNHKITYSSKTNDLSISQNDQTVVSGIPAEKGITLTAQWTYRQAFVTTPEEDAEYTSFLNEDPNGVMAYINIPRLKSTLPIYHYTTPESLQKGVGHLRGSALPVGGKNTHAVLSAHRGLPTSRLFTDLDKVRKGDHFYITVLNRTLAYEVDRISVVKPDQTKELSVQPGKDLVTLVTCTPYGVNTQRLLVRGHRVPYNAAQAKHEAADSAVSSFTVYGFVATYGTLAIALAGIAVLRRNAAARTPHHAADWPHSLTVSVR